jgi:DNA (cytosine-5)-methyltransferase 1
MKTTTREQKVGDHRGRPRIWLQGEWLAQHGWIYGITFDVVYGKNKITLKGAVPGQRKVSGKDKPSGPQPIIDINTAAIRQSITSERIKVTVGETIVIRPA